ncbi:hypothetical protein L1987_34030 [Smallanthus sonchifolius]|uniref:Uncharacterized protein n=1 Tax=Smallanthus sonchifolius TaxID=185202 RepID=A0ACB9HTX7_9ASTR|nr:hypothetical protein L1987_34030 [Smallanthus sonchifolius]
MNPNSRPSQKVQGIANFACTAYGGSKVRSLSRDRKLVSRCLREEIMDVRTSVVIYGIAECVDDSRTETC